MTDAKETIVYYDWENRRAIVINEHHGFAVLSQDGGWCCTLGTGDWAPRAGIEVLH